MADAGKLLLDLQQAVVYFQHQKQVLQGVSVQLLLDSFDLEVHTPARAGAGALLRLMGRAASHHHQLGSGKPEGHLLESTLLSTPQATPFGDNATKLETNLSPPQALSIPLKIQNPSLKELWGRKENQVEMQPVHRSNLQLGVQVHLLGQDRGAPQRWGQNSHEEPSPSTGRAQQRTRE